MNLTTIHVRRMDALADHAGKGKFGVGRRETF